MILYYCIIVNLNFKISHNKISGEGGCGNNKSARAPPAPQRSSCLLPTTVSMKRFTTCIPYMYVCYLKFGDPSRGKLGFHSIDKMFAFF